MLIHLHKQATTTPKVRAAIQVSDHAGTVLAARYGVTPQTVYKWRKRECVHSHACNAGSQARAGVHSLLLPRYSLGLNPIEKTFAKL